MKALEVNNEIADNKLIIEKKNLQYMYKQGLQDYKKYNATMDREWINCKLTQYQINNF